MTQPQHVLMTVDAVGGVWPYAIDLAHALAARGIRTTLACLGPAPSAHRRVAARRAGPLVNLLDLRHHPEWLAGSPRDVEEAADAIAALADHVDADLVHLNHPALGLAGSARPVVAVAHSCVATWWRAVRGGPAPTEFEWRMALMARAYGHADVIVAASDSFSRMTQEVYGLPRRPLVVRNGRQPPPDSERRALNEGPFAFTAGRLWDPGKNITRIDLAARRIGVPMLAAGPSNGPNGSAIRLARIRALGELDPQELDLWYRCASVFVSVPIYEPFGLAVLEAAQRGCPLVLSDIATFRELWNRAALFVPPDDEAAIAAAIETVIADPSLAARLGAAAQRRARRYSIQRMVAGTLVAYRAALRLRAARDKKAAA